MRKIKVISLIAIILFASSYFARLSDPDEIVPLFPPLTIEAVTDPSFGGFTPPPGDPVLGVQMDSESRAYPISLLEWHGVVNDVMSDEPIAVTYSFLSGSAVAYSRVLDDRILTFGVHKAVYKNSLLLRDEETQSIWTQIDGRAIKGPMIGKVLTRIPSVRTDWSNWEVLHPSTIVMEPQGNIQYGVHPYGDYRTNEQILFPHQFDDGVLGPKDPVMGLDLSGSYSAYPLSRLANERIATDEVDSTSVLIAYAYGSAFAYEAGNWSFSYVSDSMMHDQYSNPWNMTTGTSYDGNHSLAPLQANSVVCYWFAWLNLHPGTEVYGDDPRQLTERSWLVPALPWTIGLLICLLVVSVDRYAERRLRSSTSLSKWIAFRRSILLGVLAFVAFPLILTDSLGYLRVGNIAVEALFAVGFLVLGVIMVVEWLHLKGYEAARIPIERGEFAENLVAVMKLEDIRSDELEPAKFGFMRTEGGYRLVEPSVELHFSDGWLLVGDSEGYSSEDTAHAKRIIQMSLIPPQEELF